MDLINAKSGRDSKGIFVASGELHGLADEPDGGTPSGDGAHDSAIRNSGAIQRSCIECVLHIAEVVRQGGGRV